MDRRPGALGDLRVLSDEILCSILDRLAARDVSRLACVSSVMYILCNEEPLWMNLCLRDGGQLEYKGSWKKTFLLRQKPQTPSYEVAATCQPLHFDGFGSLFLYKRWYRHFTTLDAFSVNHDDLERRSNLSLNEFRSSYDGCKPVLITDLTSTWPAKHAWTVDQLLQKYGDIFFTISQRSPKKITMKFEDYVSYIKLQHDEDPLYIFDDEFAEAAPGLLEDYHVPDLFQEDYFDILDKDQRPPFRWLIIGPERSGASWHVDPALTSAWNTLLSGRKRWALYPPGRVPPGVTVHVNEEDGDVLIETPSSLQWWLDTYPLLSEEDKPVECTQQPGETIFVPSGWWHCVLNLEITIAVTQNFVNSSNFEFVCLDMAPGHVHKGVCRAGLLVPEVWNSDGTKDQLENSNESQNEKGVKEKNGKETNGHVPAENGLRSSCHNLQNGEFSYDINFLSKFLDKERDHYTSEWCPGNCIGERDMRGWLHKLWITKTNMRHLVWKGASLTLNVDKWLACISEICASHTLPSPLEEEKFPVGTGSNPVYLVSDYVIKLFVEGGLETSLQSLGTEVEFYNVLQKAQSPILNHVPIIMASGIVVYDNGVCQTKLWKGSDIPDMIQNCITSDTNHDRESSHFGVWTKMHFGCIKSKASTSAKMFPYIITRRCKGDILANLKDVLSEKDVLNLALFLGYQLHNLHVLPIPLPWHIDPEDVDKIYMESQHLNYLGEAYMLPKYPSQQANTSTGIPLECKLLIASLNERRRDLVGRLRKWGGPIPESLIKKVEEYVPHDIALLLNFTEGVDDMNLFCGSLTWLHSDIMDDNIHMEPCLPENCSSEVALDANLMVNHKVPEFGKEEFQKKWHATHILDYGNLCIGDPINDFIPLYLDVLRGDASLLKQVLASYGLPLLRNSNSSEVSCKKFQKLSYRAMCYCILHEDNVLGAIFSLWKDLKSAKSWEEVEEVVWGELNGYVPSVDC